MSILLAFQFSLTHNLPLSHGHSVISRQTSLQCPVSQGFHSNEATR